MLDLARVDFAKGGGLVTVVTQDARTGAVLMVAFADHEALERTVATGEMHYRSRRRGLWHKGATSGNVQRVVSLMVDCDGDAVLARVEPAGPACHTGAVSCFGEAALGADALGVLDATIAERARGVAGGAPCAPGRAPGPPPQLHDRAATDADQHPTSASAIVPLPPMPPVGPAVATTAAASSTAVGGDVAERSPASAQPTDTPPKPSYTARLLADRNLRLKKLGEEAAELVLACADDDSARAVEEGADIIYHTLVALRAVGVTLDDVRRALSERAPPASPRPGGG